jgi:hypothetical protein
MDDAQRENHSWNSCCFKMDSSAALFFAQLIISLFAMTFSCFQIAHKENENTFIALLTFILGVWLPSPTSSKTIK